MSILTDYLDVGGVVVREWLDSIDDIEDLLNPDIAPAEYLVYLGGLIGVKPPSDFDSSDTLSVSKFRSALNQAVDWYIVKGSYESIQIIALILQLTLTIFDMYTNDYVTFVSQEWFVAAAPGENPTGLDNTYYKSPHFGLWITLNYMYLVTAAQPYGHLWAATYLTPLKEYVERTRPAHTVPHFILYLNPQTDLFSSVVTVDGNITTQMVGTFSSQEVFFDGESLESGTGFDFDDGTLFDSSNVTTIQSITKWKLGTGSNGDDPDDSGYTDLRAEVLNGAVAASDITDEGDYYKIEFIVPLATVQAGIDELALYTAGDVLMVLSTFPEIEKDANAELVIAVFLYKEEIV